MQKRDGRKCPSPSQKLPPSFYLTDKPAFWPPDKASPPIGPDVAGGTETGLGGHVYNIPAKDCYVAMGGTTTGVNAGGGAPLTFSAATCYP